MMRANPCGTSWIQSCRSDLDLLNDGDQELSGGVPGEGRPAGTHLVKHNAEREEIGAGIELSAKRLLRRHVCGRSQCGA